MRKIILCYLLLFSASSISAQVKVKFILKEKTGIRHDSIYVTGSFCNWDSMANNNYLLKPQANGEKSILGLSLSYDIVKAHGGELKVKTKEGEESEFVISLPV